MQRTCIFLLLLIGSTLAVPLYALPSTETDYIVSGYEIVLVLHELLFVFWLGPDIGVYVWGHKAIQPDLTASQRVTAGKMMHTIDLMPRVCLSLMLTVGGILTEVVGIEHPTWQMIGIVLLGPVWLAMVLISYFREGTALGATVSRLDFWFRWGLILAIIVSVSYSVGTDRLVAAPWVTWKLLIFAALVFFGLIMRIQLIPFVDGLRQLESAGPSDELNASMAGSLIRARPMFIAIWAGLIIEAGLGIVQPGSVEVENVEAEAAAQLLQPAKRIDGL
jgi:hypothetical protein